ncbi:DUF6477 family protein [Seohaeicola zhoushanensis]|uniref:Uncharacterized protein n=1 Tax=Seohaeicola zhoushanensis TaxID=1569283 RepID=A0A8J3M769_9RHOB|nr:DUF6477 family protein [Seohaeicola zhoushanensis]GHF44842.1 hypothetical protein GCM10017056_15530 [Seohaeicola zhoushanensis]
MQDILAMLNRLRRPRLLIRAARLGARDYVRDRHLKRLLGYSALPRPSAALLRLMELERDIDDRRRIDDAGYSLSRHLDLLIAMMGEAQLVAATRAEPEI